MNNNQSSYFTLKKYNSLLKIAVDQYTFISYEETNNYEKFILLRHDLDFSVHRAFKLAAAENSAGIRSTYFLQLNSSFYNLFEEEIKNLVQKIVSLGHTIGLHFDCMSYHVSSRESLIQFLTFEKNILDSLFEIDIRVFSFHNPGDHTLQFDDLEYAGMINTYSKYFNENVAYCSDSNGYWRHEILENIIKHAKYDKLQVLIHPGWWQDEMMTPRERIKRCVEGRAVKQMKEYDNLLRSHGRLNIGK
jgi:hypothetical protein